MSWKGGAHSRSTADKQYARPFPYTIFGVHDPYSVVVGGGSSLARSAHKDEKERKEMRLVAGETTDKSNQSVGRRTTD